MNFLIVIPARGGSKGLPGKNIRPLCGKPLICYSIDIARQLVPDWDICVSTDDDQIIETVQNYGLPIPFIRPANLASDTATTNDVLLHALDFYTSRGLYYDAILLLQVTSPLRTVGQIKDALSLYTPEIDMVVSVKKSHAASVLCSETAQGFLTPTLTNATRRQDAPTFYEYNGAIYIINTKSLKEKGLSNFDREKKYVMPEINSIDIDSAIDFDLAEIIMTKYLNQNH